MRNSLRLVLAIPVLAGGLAFASAPAAQAQWRGGYGHEGYGYHGGYGGWHGGYHRGGDGWRGPGLAGALVGGLAAGAVIGALGAGYAAPPPAVVYAPPPVIYAAPPPVLYGAPPPVVYAAPPPPGAYYPGYAPGYGY